MSEFRINRVISKLEAGEPVFYTGGHAGMELSFEAGVRMADTWADYLNVGMEHGPLDIAGLNDFMKGMASVRVPTPAVIVELPFEGRSVEIVENNGWQIRQLLSAGIHGLMLCHAESPEAVEAVVKAMRYTFRGGTRGSGSQGAAGHMWGLSGADYVERADLWPLNPNGELLLGVKIENRRALENAERTTKVAGISFGEWGPSDMSMSFGYRGVPSDFVRPELQEARDRVFKAFTAARLAFLEGATEADLLDKIDQGVQIFAATPELKQFAESQLKSTTT